MLSVCVEIQQCLPCPPSPLLLGVSLDLCSEWPGGRRCVASGNFGQDLLSALWGPGLSYSLHSLFRDCGFCNSAYSTLKLGFRSKHFLIKIDMWWSYFILEEEMAAHSSILAWRIPWTEESGGLQSMGLQRVGHDWVTNSFIYLEIAVTESYYHSFEKLYVNWWY